MVLSLTLCILPLRGLIQHCCQYITVANPVLQTVLLEAEGSKGEKQSYLVT